MNEINTTEESLRLEIEQLKRQLEEQKRRAAGHGDPVSKPPTYRSLLVVVVLLALLAVAGYYRGYRAAPAARTGSGRGGADEFRFAAPGERGGDRAQRHDRQPGAARQHPGRHRSSRPGARTGYIRKRYVDIGDRVKAGQVLAEIEAPELDQQIRQAKAAVDQANSSVQQAEASLQQGRSNENLARVTAERWKKLLDKGVVSRQDNDTYQMQWAAQQANVQALEKAIAAAKSNSAAMEANVSRLNDLQSYQTVRSPFAGVITVRNIDTGVLVSEGNTLLYRVAQTDRLRTYLNVPQADAASVRVGQTATLTIPDLPGRSFPGTVARTSNALDPATRTLLVEVQVANANGQLAPGMYAQVDLSVPRKNPPLVIPGDTLVIRADGPQVAVVRPDSTVHFARVELGRDFGASLEVLSGLEEGQLLVVNPSDATREGAKVKPVQSAANAPAKKS